MYDNASMCVCVWCECCALLLCEREKRQLQTINESQAECLLQQTQAPSDPFDWPQLDPLRDQRKNRACAAAHSDDWRNERLFAALPYPQCDLLQVAGVGGGPKQLAHRLFSNLSNVTREEARPAPKNISCHQDVVISATTEISLRSFHPARPQSHAGCASAATRLSKPRLHQGMSSGFALRPNGPFLGSR